MSTPVTLEQNLLQGGLTLTNYISHDPVSPLKLILRYRGSEPQNAFFLWQGVDNSMYNLNY